MWGVVRPIVDGGHSGSPGIEKCGSEGLNTLDKALQKVSPALAILAPLTLAILLSACSSGSDDADEVKLVGVIQLIDALDPVVDGLKQGLGELEFVEGQNVSYMYRNVKGDTSLLQAYLKELTEADVDVIVSVSDPPTMAAKEATSGTGIPVIFCRRPAIMSG